MTNIPAEGDRGLLPAARAWVRERSAEAGHLELAHRRLLQLEPAARLPLQLAALTHDMERAYPEGSPAWAEGCWADPWYRIAHSERSARIVGDFLRERGAAEPLIKEVVTLVVAHECGGWPEADLLQAADSLSFLEIIQPLLERRIAERRLSPKGARDWLRFMSERIRVERARGPARALLGQALARLDGGTDGRA